MNNEQKIIKKFFLPLAKNKESLELKNDAAFFQKNKLGITFLRVVCQDHQRL